MITKICLNNVASYNTKTTLETDKKVNLIYGLNGTGKSTFSNFLKDHSEDKYSGCSVDGFTDVHDILVYNQQFIQETFFEADDLKGIFTLSKENKEAESKIARAQNQIAKLEDAQIKKSQELDKARTSINRKLDDSKNAVWKIKTEYSGGDRVLEYCLDGYKGSKDNLFNHIIGLPKSTEKPTKNIDDLKSDLQSISGNNAQKYSQLAQITFIAQTVETKNIFEKQIVGNENSSVSNLIKELGNSDWVKSGLQYLPKEEFKENATCPFCQEITISSELIDSIKNYFDASYDADIDLLKSLYEDYSLSTQSIPDKSIFEANPKYEQFKNDFETKYIIFTKVVDENRKRIEEKIKTPSISVTLNSTTKALSELNEVIQKINKHVTEHNIKIDQIETVRASIKKTFWDIMRFDYDQTINSFNDDKKASKTEIDKIDVELKDIELKIAEQNKVISEQHKQTINIEEAITNINNGLVDLGITEFKIQKHADNFYRIVRGVNQEKIFNTLSEGEKMIISFLYFIELCRGKKEIAEVGRKKIVVIDDPISSLSHIYVFNVGRLIHNEFLRSVKYEQVFLLTHSLYFFYEMTDVNRERRKENQKLFRIRKNSTGSEILEMSYEEIQNDYQSYWFVIKDDKQPEALIANCMRNIIEYFFNFVEKSDLNNFFQKREMQAPRFQAFNRYVNRESHSLGQNIFDIKEFNYQDFKEAFAELFKITGYEDHYKKMMR